MQRALKLDQLPDTARHATIDAARNSCEHLRICQLENLKSNLIEEMARQTARRTA
jgi:hypothetical protein